MRFLCILNVSFFITLHAPAHASNADKCVTELCGTASAFGQMAFTPKELIERYYSPEVEARFKRELLPLLRTRFRSLEKSLRSHIDQIEKSLDQNSSYFSSNNISTDGLRFSVGHLGNKFRYRDENRGTSLFSRDIQQVLQRDDLYNYDCVKNRSTCLRIASAWIEAIKPSKKILRLKMTLNELTQNERHLHACRLFSYLDEYRSKTLSQKKIEQFRQTILPEWKREFQDHFSKRGVAEVETIFKDLRFGVGGQRKSMSVYQFLRGLWSAPVQPYSRPSGAPVYYDLRFLDEIPIDALALLDHFGINCDFQVTYLADDEFDDQENSIHISSFSVLNPAYGKTIFFHELAHALDFYLLGPEAKEHLKTSELASYLSSKKNCIDDSLYKPRVSQYLLESLLKETFADALSFAIPTDSQNLSQCYSLSKSEDGNSFLSNKMSYTNQIGTHPSDSLRVVQEALYRDIPLPESCERALKTLEPPPTLAICR